MFRSFREAANESGYNVSVPLDGAMLPRLKAGFVANTQQLAFGRAKTCCGAGTVLPVVELFSKCVLHI